MKGFIIKLGNEFLNWQGMWSPLYNHALFFLTSEAAQVIAQHYEGSSVVVYETPKGTTPENTGSFHEYHRDI